MKKKILIIDDVPDFFIRELKIKGFEVNYNVSSDKEAETINKMIKDYTYILVRSSLKIDSKILNRAKNLKVILRPGSGLDNVDIVYANKKGIKVINSPEGNRDAVGDHVLGLILSLSKNIFNSFNEVIKGKWNREENRGFELTGKTLGIIGYGNTGSAVAGKVSGTGIKVIAYDKYKKGFSNEFVKEVEINEILNESDILSVHVPLTKETQNLINHDFLIRMKAGSYIINTSRGKVLNTKDLLKAIKSNHISGAALDVLEVEPPYKNKEYYENAVKPLLESGKVIITPHIAGWSRESKINNYKILLDKLN